MTATATLDTVPPDVSERYVTYFGTVALSSNYATGGEAVDMSALRVHVGWAPVQMTFYSENGNTYGWAKGTTLANQKIKLFSAINTELAAGAIPAANTGDTVRFAAKFTKSGPAPA